MTSPEAPVETGKETKAEKETPTMPGSSPHKDGEPGFTTSHEDEFINVLQTTGALTENLEKISVGAAKEIKREVQDIIIQSGKIKKIVDTRKAENIGLSEKDTVVIEGWKEKAEEIRARIEKS